jgi:hypothetical protein
VNYYSKILGLGSAETECTSLAEMVDLIICHKIAVGELEEDTLLDDEDMIPDID